MATRKMQRQLKRAYGPIRLADGLEKSLSAYASAAAGAGVSLLALAPAANAKIVYTPTNTPIPVNQYVLVDLNHDGIADFGLYNFAARSGGARLWVGCALHTVGGILPPNGRACSYQTNQVWGRGMVSSRFVSVLRPGFTVRANKAYFQAPPTYIGALMGGVSYGKYGSWSTTRGQWLYAKNRYLGLQFVIKGQVHYGWARLSVTLKSDQILAVLSGYAYEDIPNKPIVTGKIKGPNVVTLEPATLGHLAGGASQIPAWRVARNRFEALKGSRSKAGPSSQAAP